MNRFIQVYLKDGSTLDIPYDHVYNNPTVKKFTPKFYDFRMFLPNNTKREDVVTVQIVDKEV